jgi:hypothetical protein
MVGFAAAARLERCAGRARIYTDVNQTRIGFEILPERPLPTPQENQDMAPTWAIRPPPTKPYAAPVFEAWVCRTLGSVDRQKLEFGLVERDCANYSRAALLSDARIRTTKPRFVVGAGAVISGSASVIDRCAVSGAGHAPKRPLGIAQVPGRCPTSEAARGRCRRDQSPQSRRSQQRSHCGCADRGFITRQICGVHQ